MKPTAHIIGFATIGMVVWANAAAATSLREAVGIAVASNPRIDEATANRRAVDEKLNQARGLYLPKLDLEASSGFLYNHQPEDGTINDRRWGDSAALIGRQTLFDGGFRASEVAKQIARVGGAKERVRERSEIVAIETIRAYLDVLRFTQIQRLAIENIANHRRYVALANKRFRGGSASRGEVDLSSERLFAAESTLENVKRTVGLAKARYLNLVGRPPKYLAPVGRPPGVPNSRRAVRNRARALNPTLLAAALDGEAAKAEFDQTAAAFRPKVALEARGTVGHDQGATPGPDHDASAQLKLNWNLYDGRIKDARRREKAERLAEVDARLGRLRRAVEEAVDRAWVDMQSADARLQILDRQVGSGRALVISYRKEFDTGLRSLLDLLQAVGVLFNSRVQRTTTGAVTVLARYEILASMGGLVKHFGLDAGPDADAGVRPWNRSSSRRGWAATVVHK
jgi:adhesin transport system outer membrane protein